MERSELRQLMEAVASGATSVDDAVAQVGMAPFEDLGYAKPDMHRGMRTGASEVIYGAGKTAEQIVGIMVALANGGQRHVLCTRVDAHKARDVEGLIREQDLQRAEGLTYYEVPQALVLGGKPKANGNGSVVVACAGTSDLYCAEEAALTAEMMGSNVTRLYDVGVAGLHRLLSYGDVLQKASAVVAVAGMEGALASVVGGLCACPVIACPTSVGYGASFGGVAALLAMLNSCSSGTSVVNIDNGYGAGFQAALIDHARTS
ncbi:MAG: nickel pincer cofactor biosynthesis protein LarB [Atopobiaceae bacterium]|nr:nickel pincer cofactor biosynthesis protein LarB [Atopobiaceae bacterium]